MVADEFTHRSRRRPRCSTDISAQHGGIFPSDVETGEFPFDAFAE
jgi:hypothetical protein